MKKVISIILMLCLLLAACGKDYDRRTFDLLGDDFRWDMTIEEAECYIKEHKINAEDIDIDRFQSGSSVSDDFFIFRFDANGKIEFVKIRTEADAQMLDLLVEKYGNYDKEDHIDDDPLFYWYGTMDGRRTQMLLEYSSLFDTCYIEFTYDD